MAKLNKSFANFSIFPALFNLIHGPNLMKVFSESIADNLNEPGHYGLGEVNRLRCEADLLKWLCGSMEDIL